MALAKCVFCGREQDDFKGLYLIKNEGVMVYYCSSKCKKNQIKLGRDKRKVRWTEAFHQHRAKAVAKANAAEAAASAKK